MKILQKKKFFDFFTKRVTLQPNRSKFWGSTCKKKIFFDQKIFFFKNYFFAFLWCLEIGKMLGRFLEYSYSSFCRNFRLECFDIRFPTNIEFFPFVPSRLKPLSKKFSRIFQSGRNLDFEARNEIFGCLFIFSEHHNKLWHICKSLTSLVDKIFLFCQQNSACSALWDRSCWICPWIFASSSQKSSHGLQSGRNLDFEVRNEIFECFFIFS